MLTVKLFKRVPYNFDRLEKDKSSTDFVDETTVLEADEVDIRILRPGELKEIIVRNKGLGLSYYVSKKGEILDGFADSVPFYYAAFIENSSGATTESVVVR